MIHEAGYTIILPKMNWHVHSSTWFTRFRRYVANAGTTAVLVPVLPRRRKIQAGHKGLFIPYASRIIQVSMSAAIYCNQHNRVRRDKIDTMLLLLPIHATALLRHVPVHRYTVITGLGVICLWPKISERAAELMHVFDVIWVHLFDPSTEPPLAFIKLLRADYHTFTSYDTEINKINRLWYLLYPVASWRSDWLMLHGLVYNNTMIGLSQL